MPREVTDSEGIRWTCVEAYAGISGDAGDAAKVGAERYRVVCTPSGASKSVELHLLAGWEDSLSDDDLLREIAGAREDQP